MTDPSAGRRWNQERVLALVSRVRWAIMNHVTSNKDLCRKAKLDERFKHTKRKDANKSCDENFSRWLHHAHENKGSSLLHDDELDRVQAVVHGFPAVPVSLLQRLLPPDHLFDMLEGWLKPTENANTRRSFFPEYTIYRASAIMPGRIVRGSLKVHRSDSGALTTQEEYVLTDYGEKSATYRAQGYLIGSRDTIIYMLSRFENADLQMIVFTEYLREGSGPDRILSMSGALLNTMANKPYAVRVVCRAQQRGKDSATEIPADVEVELRKGIDPSTSSGISPIRYE